MATKKQLLDEIADLALKHAELKIEMNNLKLMAVSMPDDKPKTGRVYPGELGIGDDYFVVIHTSIRLWHFSDDAKDAQVIAIGLAFHDKESAEQYIRYLKLWQDCRIAMREDWGDVEVDWEDSDQVKRTVQLCKNTVENNYHIGCSCHYHAIHFHTQKGINQWRSTVTNNDIKLMLMGV